MLSPPFETVDGESSGLSEEPMNADVRRRTAAMAIAALPEAEAGYVVTRSRPYPLKVVAVSGWRLGTA